MDAASSSARPERDGLFGAVTLAFAIGLAFAVIAGFFGGGHPFLDTLSHFRAHLSLSLFACAVLLCVARLWAAGLASLAAACLGIATVVPYFLPAAHSPELADGPRYTLLQLNLRFDLVSTSRTLQLIDDLSPDVVTVQEMTGGWHKAFDSIRQRYPYQYFCAPPGYEADAGILSRRPFVEGERGTCDVHAGFAAKRIDFDGVAVVVGSEHLKWPWPGQQWSQIERLIPTLAVLGKPLVIGGDFNATPWSAAANIYAAASGTRLVAGIGPTWIANGLPVFLGRLIGLPIDQVLVSPDIEVVSVERPGSTGSDHLPVLLTFTLRREDPAAPKIQTVGRSEYVTIR